MKVVLLLITFKVMTLNVKGWDFEKNFGNTNSWGAEPTANECETDTGSCQCCLTMQKVNNVKMNLTKKLNEMEAELNKTQKMYTDLTSERSAFSAALFESISNLKCLGPFSDTRTIIYKKVFTNLGNNYSSVTGIYTAPFSGIYSISVSVFHDAGVESNEQSCVLVLVNGVMFAGSQDNHTFDHEDSTTVSVTVRLNKGDKVEVKLKAGCILCMLNDNYNVFSGFLLYAD